MVDNKNRVLSGAFFAAGAFFLLEEVAAWALTQILDQLPLQKLPNGNTDLSALPWADMVGILLLLASIWIFWRGRPKVREAVPSQDENTSQVANLQSQLNDLQAQIPALIDTYLQTPGTRHFNEINALREDFKALEAIEERVEQKLAPVTKVADACQSKAKAEILAKSIEQMRNVLPPPPTDSRSSGVENLNKLRRAGTDQNRAREQLDMLRRTLPNRIDADVDPLALTAAKTAAVARVEADARYLTLLPEDEGLAWTSPDEKREWHLRQAPMEAEICFYESMLHNYRQNSDVLKFDDRVDRQA